MTHEELANANALDAKITEIKKKIEPLMELRDRVRKTCGQYQQFMKIQIAEGYVNTPQPEVSVKAFLLFVDSEIKRYQKEMDELEKELSQYYPKGDRIPKEIVNVIRCKECKHYPVGGDQYEHTLKFPDERCPCYCEDKWYSWRPGDNWFCANGERKDNV